MKCEGKTAATTTVNPVPMHNTYMPLNKKLEKETALTQDGNDYRAQALRLGWDNRKSVEIASEAFLKLQTKQKQIDANLIRHLLNS